MNSFYNTDFEPASYSGVRGDRYEPPMQIDQVNTKKLYQHVRPMPRQDFSDSLTDYMDAHPEYPYYNVEPMQTYYNHEAMPSMHEPIEEFNVSGPGNYVYNGVNPFDKPKTKSLKKSHTKKGHRKGGKKSRKQRRRKH